MTKNKRKSSQDLIEIALYQLLYKKEYDDISVKDICEKAGVSRMSFYRTYDKKDDIFIHFCDEKFAEFFDMVSKEDNITGYDFALMLIRYVYQFKRQLMMMQKANRLELLRDQLFNYWSYVLKKIDMTDVSVLKDNPITIPFISGGAFYVIKSWIENSYKETPEQMAYWFIHMFD